MRSKVFLLEQTKSFLSDADLPLVTWFEPGVPILLHLVDVSYPPNKLVFGDYATPDAPAIIFKNPIFNTSSENHMIYRKRDDYDNLYFEFNPQITNWGSFKPFKGKQFTDSVYNLQFVYSLTYEYFKFMSVFLVIKSKEANAIFSVPLTYL